MGFGVSSFYPSEFLNSVKDTLWYVAGQTGPSCKVPSSNIAVQTNSLKPVMANAIGNSFIKIAGFSGALAVVMGAYGAHVFLKRKDVPDELKDVYRTGNQYHFLHSLALLAVPVVKRPLLVGSLISSGMLIFCGTCYLYSMTGDKALGRAAPYGGTLLILGWISMIF